MCIGGRPDTDPVLDEPGLVEMLKFRARKLSRCRVFPLGALARRLEGQVLTEMIELTEAGCVGFSQVDVPVTNTLVLMRALQYADDAPQSYTPPWFDTWRFVDGKADEHWDPATLPAPAPAAAATCSTTRHSRSRSSDCRSIQRSGTSETARPGCRTGGFGFHRRSSEQNHFPSAAGTYILLT